MSERLDRARLYHEAIRDILLGEWDPIGIVDEPDAQDEYDGYICEIHGLLIRHEPRHRLFDHLWWVETDHMALFGNRQRTCEAGDPRAAADRVVALAGVPLLEQTPEAAALAESLLQGGALPGRAAADAVPIAIATVHGIDYLLTWNCAHIANVTVRPSIESACRAAGD